MHKIILFSHHHLFCQFFCIKDLNSDASGTDGIVDRVNINLEKDGGVVEQTIDAVYSGFKHNFDFMGKGKGTVTIKYYSQDKTSPLHTETISVNSEEYTKYSFPSKIMEYVSTGKPTICYKLDGIPDEYDNILIFPMDNSIESLSQCIVDVSNYNEKQMNEIYLKSRNIMLEKSPRNTIIKIFRMIEKELK